MHRIRAKIRILFLTYKWKFLHLAGSHRMCFDPWLAYQFDFRLLSGSFVWFNSWLIQQIDFWHYQCQLLSSPTNLTPNITPGWLAICWGLMYRWISWPTHSAVLGLVSYTNRAEARSTLITNRFLFSFLLNTNLPVFLTTPLGGNETHWLLCV